MQQDNNIENKLRDLEAMEQPELGQMDAHWQQMAGMLQPPVLPLKKGWPKWMLNGFSAAAVVLLVGAAMWFVSTRDTGEIKSKDVVYQDTAVLEKAKVVITGAEQEFMITDTVISPTVSVIPSSIKVSLIQEAHGYGEPVLWTKQDSVLSKLKLNYTPCDGCNDKSNNDNNGSQIAAATAQPAALLKSFFSSLEKPVQSFEINSAKDTTIICNNGTNVFIPANTFIFNDSGVVNGPVIIRIKEFYNYEEIVGSKLNTVSNGQQLVSAGMVYISAVQSEKELKVAPVKQIKLKIPVTKPYDEEMQLFTVQQNPQNGHVDTASSVNWQPAGQYQRLSRSKFRIKIFDPHGQPYKVIERKDGSKWAKFVIRDNCKMSNKDVLRALKERYGMFYDKITLRRSLSDNPKPLFSKKPYPVVGDSVEIDFAAAIKMKILSDKEIERYQQQLMNDSIAWSNKLNSIPFYEFQLSRLGYFNCDRFNNANPRINFTLTLNATEEVQNLFSVLAFDKYRSVVQGYYGINELRFLNVPKGEKVHVISVGVKNGAIVSSIQPFTISESDNLLQFTETTPVQFAAQLKQLHLQ